GEATGRPPPAGAPLAARVQSHGGSFPVKLNQEEVGDRRRIGRRQFRCAAPPRFAQPGRATPRASDVREKTRTVPSFDDAVELQRPRESPAQGSLSKKR